MGDQTPNSRATLRNWRQAEEEFWGKIREKQSGDRRGFLWGVVAVVLFLMHLVLHGTGAT